MTNQTTNSNEPIARVKDGLLQIAIWKNTTEDKRVFYSTSAVERSYKVDEKNYNVTNSLSGTQLLQAGRLYALAYNHIRGLEEADYQANKANQA